MLFAAACQVGAQLGGANERESELFWQFGRNLGLGVAALTRGLGDKLVGNAFSKARDFLTSLPAPIPPLSDIGSYFEGQVSKVHS